MLIVKLPREPLKALQCNSHFCCTGINLKDNKSPCDSLCSMLHTTVLGVSVFCWRKKKDDSIVVIFICIYDVNVPINNILNTCKRCPVIIRNMSPCCRARLHSQPLSKQAVNAAQNNFMLIISLSQSNILLYQI